MRSITRTRSIKHQFMIYFSLVIGMSLVVTALVWISAFVVMNHWPTWVKQPNYAENQVPAIKAYIEGQGDRLLRADAQSEFERKIPAEDMGYAVTDRRGVKLYGSLSDLNFAEGKPLITLLNTSMMTKGNVVHKVLPITDEAGDLSGMIILRYVVDLNTPSPWLTTLLRTGSVFLVLLPFVLVILFTWLLGKRFGKRLSAPIHELIAGTRRVQQRDLDFSFSYRGVRELEQLTEAFEDMRDELQQSLQREWQMEQQRRDMVAALAHDLRTPLTIIQGHVEGLLAGGLERPDRLARYLATIDKNTRRATKLIQEINQVSEMEKPDYLLAKRPVELAEFCKEKADEFAKLCRGKDLAFSYLYEDFREKQNPVLIDPDKISQVIENLVTNSMRFTPAGGTISMTVSVEQEKWSFNVTDTGPGFPAEGLSSVFEKFYQGDASRSKSNQGHSGLGLYIAQLLTQRHGGTIQASNGKEGGACVEVSLPISSR